MAETSPVPVRSFLKDPDERLDYSFDWKGVLVTDEAIASSEWLLGGQAWAGDAVLMLVAHTYGDTGTTVWISGGSDGESYELTNRIVTDSSPQRRFDRTMRIQITAR